MGVASILYGVGISTWCRSIRDFRSDLRATGKPREVEGVLDTFLIRPSGLLVTRLVRSTTISPTALSAAAVVTGWVAAYYFFLTAKSGNQSYFGWLAALALFVHSAFDSADGQLARWRNEASELGRLIDGISDYLTFLAIYLAIGFGLDIAHQSSLPVFVVVAILAGASHALQCALVEYQRNLYRHLALGTELGAAISPEGHARTLKQNATGLAWLLHILHVGYSRSQQLFCGSSMLLGDRARQWKQQNPELQAQLGPVIEASHGKILKMWALLAPNSHKVGMVLGAILPVSAAPKLGSLGLLWYFIYVIGLLNLFMIVLLFMQRSIDRKTWEAIQSVDSSDISGDRA